MSSTLKKKITSNKATIAVLGLGYVGLPLAISFAKKGFRVLGLDKDADRVQRVQAKKNYITDVCPRDLRAVVDSGRLAAGTDFAVVGQADVVIICVPTPLRRKYTPDISYIVGAVRAIRGHLKKGVLVVLESTTYPGTTREMIKPELEKSGLKVGRDFFLAFSPERIDPGNKTYDVTHIPKVVGGITPRCGELTRALYEKVIQSIHVVSSAETAEMTKLLENSFRIINIGWINEVAMMCHKLDLNVWEVIEAAKTKPFGFMPFYPGLGVGGHCIPDDPLYLYWKAKQYGFSSKYLKLSADTNSHMVDYAVGRIRELLKTKKKALGRAQVLILGVTYKKDIHDLRKSPALRLISQLQHERALVDYHDPIIPYLEFKDIHLKSVPLTATQIKNYDIIIIATDHTRVRYDLIRRHARLIFDTRNVYQGRIDPKIVRL